MADPVAEAQADHALVARVLLTDDRRAFEQLLRRHQGMVRAQLRRLLHGDEARADDLAQETFLLAWRKLYQFRGEARFSTWLYSIAYSCFLQAYRKRSAAAEGIAAGAPEEWTTPRDAAELR
ncbi:MAG: sigma-70 family RNA polymerase sigma factor, partial [Brevundimonas sp.]|nr:sigma-70 family RNA polymerase sigma factor [Brevundimonas sp.]